MTRVAEYSRRRKTEGRRLFCCVLLCVLYASFLVFILWSTLRFGNAFLLAGLCVVGLALVLLTVPMFRETIDYEIVENEMRLYRVYGNSRSRLVYECDLHRMTRIAPLTDETAAELRRDRVERTYDYLSSSASPDAYAAIYEEDGRPVVLLFDCDEKFEQVIRTVNPRAFVRRPTA